jgi:hypothetical protein
VDLVNLKKSYLEGSFAVRAVKPFYPNNQWRWYIYFPYFHFIMTYGLVFLGNFYHNNAVFKL